MVLKNKLQITDSVELARIEEKVSKKKGFCRYRTRCKYCKRQF